MLCNRNMLSIDQGRLSKLSSLKQEQLGLTLKGKAPCYILSQHQHHHTAIYLSVL